MTTAGGWVRGQAEKAIVSELEKREALGLEDEPEDLGDVPEVPLPGTHEKDRRVQRRIRTGKRWSEIIHNVEIGNYTWEQFVSALHPRELARGQLFDSRGGFGGRPPSLVPRAFHDACIRELMKRGRVLYQENYLDAIKVMTEIAKNPLTKEADRLKAAQFVIERLEGKVPDRIEVIQAAPWEEMISGLIAEVSEDTAIANAQEYLERREDVNTGD